MPNAMAPNKIMKYSDLIKKEQQHLSGKIGKFMDDYIRRHQVWNPKQMYQDFMLKIEDEISQDLYTIFIKDYPPGGLSMKSAVIWLTTNNGRELVLTRMINKYEKERDVANRRKPIVEKVRFGKKWDSNQFYEITYGMKTSVGYIPMTEFKKLSDIPWSVGFVNMELSKIGKSLEEILIQLSESPLEQKFYKYWLENYCRDDIPALIPEVCGFRTSFYYYEFNDNFYGKWEEIPGSREEKWSGVQYHNFRYDFVLINYKRQKIGIIELDGFEHHKTRTAQTIDSIKRNQAMKLNCDLFNFTSKRINEDIDSVFKEIEDYIN